jgi:hypothetical protein
MCFPSLRASDTRTGSWVRLLVLLACAGAGVAQAEEGICRYNPNQEIVQPDVTRWGATVLSNLALADTLNLKLVPVRERDR